jgi:bis(5'-nucleosyl)-tetraphosphatase (symmetrical)
MVHAGLLPQWTAEKALQLAREVQDALRGPNFAQFLAAMYGGQPSSWDESLKGADRLRVIVNAMTRMRFCTRHGEMEFRAKGETSAAPQGYLPWFDVPDRTSRDMTIVCGHWSALGLLVRPDLYSLDSGCVWGGRLTALRLEDAQVFQVECASQRR